MRMGLMSVNDRLHNPNCNVPICQFELLLGLSLIVSVDIVIRHGRIMTGQQGAMRLYCPSGSP